MSLSRVACLRHFPEAAEHGNQSSLSNGYSRRATATGALFLLDPPTDELHESDGSEAAVGDDSTGGTGRETLNIKNKLGRSAGIAIAAAGIVALNLPGEASASTAEAGLPICTIKTTNGHFLTAVDGGGHTTNAIQSDRTVASTWEKFALVPAGDNVHVGLRTSNGNWLTAVGGGGQANADAIHTDATVLSTWEEFSISALPTLIQVVNGDLLTAVDGGGRTTEAVHTNATLSNFGSWEEFQLACTHDL